MAAAIERRGGRLPRNMVLAALCLAFAVLSFLWVLVSWWNYDVSFGLAPVPTGASTRPSSPRTRLLHVLALAYLIATIAALSRWSALPLAHPPMATGRHALAMFIGGTIVAMIGQC